MTDWTMRLGGCAVVVVVVEIAAVVGPVWMLVLVAVDVTVCVAAAVIVVVGPRHVAVDVEVEVTVAVLVTVLGVVAVVVVCSGLIAMYDRCCSPVQMVNGSVSALTSSAIVSPELIVSDAEDVGSSVTRVGEEHDVGLIEKIPELEGPPSLPS